MKFYLAPMEGITGYIFRNAHKKYFDSIDTYISPFIAPNQNRCMNSRERQDILPEHNPGIHLVPQILTKSSADFTRTCEELMELGYTEVNLNLGCPSATVVSKKKGAGFLGEPEDLEQFLEEIFRELDQRIHISIKTRLGMEDAEEFQGLLDIYNQYPLTELIVHPRLRKDFYNGKPDWASFALATEQCRMPVCYNGDIFSRDDYERLAKQFPQLDRIMLGRGILSNPNLIGDICGKEPLEKERLRMFHETLLEDYAKILSPERNLLFKMKELWLYLGSTFENPEKYLKKIKKANRLSEYKTAVDTLFAQQELRRASHAKYTV